jgi:predicted site-specific integrase-resolvase
LGIGGCSHADADLDESSDCAEDLQRRYRVADLQALLPEMPAIGQASRCLLYARVSTKKQQAAGNLDRQLGRLTTFAGEQHGTVIAA